MILPFFLFSALAGQVADKYDKASLVRKIKFAEVCIMSAAAVGFFFDAVYFLLGVLFCMGLQSTFFGPIKYSIIPQHLSDKELVSGNALVEMGTFLAILLGSISGVLLKMEGMGDGVVAIAVVGLALLGYLAARGIPSAPAADHGLKLNWNGIEGLVGVIGLVAFEEQVVWIHHGVGVNHAAAHELVGLDADPSGFPGGEGALGGAEVVLDEPERTGHPIHGLRVPP